MVHGDEVETCPGFVLAVLVMDAAVVVVVKNVLLSLLEVVSLGEVASVFKVAVVVVSVFMSASVATSVSVFASVLVRSVVENTVVMSVSVVVVGGGVVVGVAVVVPVMERRMVMVMKVSGFVSRLIISSLILRGLGRSSHLVCCNGTARNKKIEYK